MEEGCDKENDSMNLYAATTNTGKLREFAECAQGEGVTVEVLPGIAFLPVPVEDAVTFAGNAELKALAYSRALMESRGPGLLVMADDSGLEVEALGGRPGVYSARFAETMGFGPEIEPGLAEAWAGMGKDARNNACLLSMLAHLPSLREDQSTRFARFVCALAVARDGKVVLRAEGTVSGEVLMAPRGANGFGYDPLFLLPELGLTMAELPAERKWAVSHRGQAFRELLGELAALPI